MGLTTALTRTIQILSYLSDSLCDAEDIAKHLLIIDLNTASTPILAFEFPFPSPVFPLIHPYWRTGEKFKRTPERVGLPA